MDTATDTTYTFRLEDYEGRAGVIAGSGETLEAALEGAWRLNRHSESAVLVYDPRDTDDLGNPRAVARVSCEWLDGAE